MKKSRLPIHLKKTSLLNPLNANFTKWSNTLKQLVGKDKNGNILAALLKKDITDNKFFFWQTVEPLLSNNVKLRKKIFLNGILKNSPKT